MMEYPLLSRLARSGLKAGLLPLALVFACAKGVSAQSFAPNETRVSAESELVDPEYSQSRAQFTWVDRSGRLWIGNIDRRTGQFLPPDGRGILVDPASMSTNDIRVVGNGPEWISTSAGEQIVYTRFLPGQPRTMATARLAMALEQGDGTWIPSTLDDLPRNAPYASRDPGDAQPRISYIDELGNHYWRNLFEPASETLVPGYPPSFWVSMRFVDGERATVFRGPDPRGRAQVFKYWLDTGTVEQLTWDNGHSGIRSAAWMWRAPEFNNEHVLATVANQNRELRIYRKLNPTGRKWSVVRTITAPNGGTISSPEPFVHLGFSYLFMSLNPAGAQEPTGIAVASIDPARPLFRKVTPDDDTRVRKDPELFITENGVFLYYNRFNPALTTTGPGDLIVCDACNEGIWRSNIGMRVQ